MQVYLSRHTKGVTGDQILFGIGERVGYRLRDGRVVAAIIASERMRHPDCHDLGYECTFPDLGGERQFANGRHIVEWDADPYVAKAR